MLANLERAQKAWLQQMVIAPGGSYGGISAPSSANRSIVHQIFASMFGWGAPGQLAATDQLLMHESGYRNTAQNPTSTAYGMFQFLDSTWAGTGIGKTSDPRLQAIAGGRYIGGRYGSPIGAWGFWQGHHWYDQGGRILEDILGVGRSGRTYSFQKDEFVTPRGGGGGGAVQQTFTFAPVFHVQGNLDRSVLPEICAYVDKQFRDLNSSIATGRRC